MTRLLPLLIAVVIGLVMYRFSVWKSGKDLDRRSRPLNDPALESLIARMAQELDLPRIRVFVLDADPVNGLAAADGRIFLTRGFMEKYRDGLVTAEELASVVAHELGHVALGHAQRRMIDFSAQNALRVLLLGMIGRIVPFVGIYIVNFLLSLIAAKLSRKDEFEADAYAAALLTKAGIGITPQIHMFRKLDYLAGKTNGQLAWLMSHPDTGERIAALQQLEKGWK